MRIIFFVMFARYSICLKALKHSFKFQTPHFMMITYYTIHYYNTGCQIVIL
jgi:hypothetical protein